MKTALLLLAFFLLVFGAAGRVWAQTGPVSAAAPLYLYSHFRSDDSRHLRLSFSRDGVHFTDLNAEGVFRGASLRDPSLLYIPNEDGSGGSTYFLATAARRCRVQFLSTTDYVHYRVGPPIDMARYVEGCETAWALEWWHDPGTGKYYFWVAIGKTAWFTYKSPKDPWLVEFDPATGSVVGDPVEVRLDGTTQGNTFDYFPYYADGTYYLFYVDQQGTPQVKQPIAYATASSLSGPYTQQTRRGSDTFQFGTLRTEAPALFEVGNSGCVRILVDEWTYGEGTAEADDFGRVYRPFYRDSCPSRGKLFSKESLVEPAAPIEISGAEHGTVLPMVDAGGAAVVFRAAGLIAPGAPTH